MKEKLKFILSTIIIVIGVAIPAYAVQVGGAGHNNGDYDTSQIVQVNNNNNNKDEETGQARILAGDTMVKVEFDETYDELPVVVLSPMNALLDGLDYIVKDVSNFGFIIEIDHTYLVDVDFSWHAFEVEDGLSYVSDGTVEEIEVLMVEAKEAEKESEKIAGEANEVKQRVHVEESTKPEEEEEEFTVVEPVDEPDSEEATVEGSEEETSESEIAEEPVEEAEEEMIEEPADEPESGEETVDESDSEEATAEDTEEEAVEENSGKNLDSTEEAEA